MNDEERKRRRPIISVTAYSSRLSGKKGMGGEPEVNSALGTNRMSRQERSIILSASGPMKRLPYPTHKERTIFGDEIEIYEIPEDKREAVFKELFVFVACPSLDTRFYDLHENALFIARDYLVTREGEGNFLVSPYYLRSGGTVLDWVTPPKKDGSESESGMIAECQEFRPDLSFGN